MIRRPARFSFFAAALTLVTGTVVYGCGGSDSSVDDVDGAVPGEDGSPDGTITPPQDGDVTDSAKKPDADAGKLDDAAKDGETGVDAEVDSGDSGVVVDMGPLSPTYVDYDFNHILMTGQSNAVASGARPSTTLPLNTVAITSTQPFTNVMFQTGVMTSNPCNGSGCPNTSYVAPTSFVPLIEGDTFFGGAYVVETASSAMANLISQLATTTFQFGNAARPTYPTKHDVLVREHGRSGNKYVCLRKTAQTDPDRLPPNTVPAECVSTLRPAFKEGMMQAQAGYDIAVGMGKTDVVRAVTTIHGESDHNGLEGDFPMRGSDGVAGKIKNYADALIEWQQDYEAGVQAITGQVLPVPLFVMGISGWTGPATYPGEPEAPRYSPLASQQHDAHVRAPGKVILVGPGYFLDQGTAGGASTQPECLHVSIVGQRQIGEYFAKVYAKVVFKGETWEPVHPKTVTRVNNVVTVEYFVPVPPLVIDTTLVTARAGENYGFDYRVGGHTGAKIAINSVVVSGPTTVTITLASTPAGADQRLIYAQNQPAFGAGCTGPGIESNGALYAGGSRGNLRDSDATVSRYGYNLYNWGVIYDVPVP